ncbi:MAG: hypothetical protein AAFU49_15235 [Pseudomonadota bacterium]
MASVAAIAALLVVAFRLLIPEQFADPFVRHDDYLALRPEPDLYYWKTLAKGRWVTWLWTLREWPSDPILLWWIAIAVWCLGAAAVGVGMFRSDRLPVRAALAAVAVALMPQAADISTWYAATLPAALTVTTMALVACLAGPRIIYGAMLALVPVAVMAHSSYPLLVLLVAALAGDWRTRPRAWVELPLVFCASLALGILLMLVLNGTVHGHFGIKAASWIEESTTSPSAGLAERLSFTAIWLVRSLALMANGQPALGLLLSALALLGLALALWRAPRRALPVMSAAIVAFGIGAAPALLEGISTPSRATGYLWLIIVGSFALALAVLEARARQAIFVAGLIITALGAGTFWHSLYGQFLPPYQEMSRNLAARLTEASAGRPETIVIAGQIHGLPETEPLQFSIGLSFRLQRLTGAEPVLCTQQTTDELRYLNTGVEVATAEEYAGWARSRDLRQTLCETWGAAVDAMPPYPASGSARQLAPGVLGLRLPDTARSDAPP